MSALLLHVHNKLLILLYRFILVDYFHIGVVITLRDAKIWYQTLGIGLLITLVSYCLSLDFQCWIPFRICLDSKSIVWGSGTCQTP